MEDMLSYFEYAKIGYNVSNDYLKICDFLLYNTIFYKIHMSFRLCTIFIRQQFDSTSLTMLINTFEKRSSRPTENHSSY